MVEVKVINENLKIEVAKDGNNKTINIYRKNVKIESLSFTIGSSLYKEFKYDSNYLLIYSKIFSKPASEKIEFLYDIQNDERVYLDEHENLETIIKYMFLYSRDFDIETVLSVINNNDLKIATEESVESFYNYLTTANSNITKEEVVSYILKQYPALSKYTSLPERISVVDYKKMMKEFYFTKLSFHRISQIIDLEKLNNKDTQRLVKKTML